MKNPYEVLGISPNATQEQIKEAYRNLAKKYHPDNYADSPLRDVAEEKMREVNEAYDNVMQNLKSRGNSNQYNGQSAYQNSELKDIRQLIMNNRLVEAEELLNGIPYNNRTAEWYFLKGSIFYSRGWFDDAYANFNSACNLDPNNLEYRTALNRMNSYSNFNYGNMYNQSQRGMYNRPAAGQGCSICDLCTCLCCADLCCDLTRCC